MSIPLSSACNPFALEIMIGLVPCAGAAGIADSGAPALSGRDRPKSFPAPAAKLLATEAKKNFRRDHISIAIPP
jgi:hypothetical protein